MKWAGHVACMGKEKNAYRISAEKPEGLRPLGRPTRRQDTERCGTDWIHLAQDRDQWKADVNIVMNLRVP
jgi:hypothetical protein